MKIAICVNFFYPATGGSEFVTKRIAEHFSKNHEVAVFTRSSSSRKKNRIDNILIHEYEPLSPKSFLLKLKKYNPDTILIYGDVFDFAAYIITDSEFKRRILFFTGGGSRLLSTSSLLSCLSRNLDNIKTFVCHSRSVPDYELLMKLNVIDKTRTIPCGVDLEEFDKNTLSRRDILKKDDNNPWILNVSNFFPGKGQEYLLEIIDRSGLKDITYIQACSSSSFLITEQLETRWKDHSKKLVKKGVNVVLIKNKPREIIVGAFKNSNIFAFTSQKESFGLVFLESMAAGCPWISSNVGITGEISGGTKIIFPKDKNSNCIFDHRSIEFFAQKLKNCLINPISEKSGRAEVEEKYQWENILPVYDNLL